MSNATGDPVLPAITPEQIARVLRRSAQGLTRLAVAEKFEAAEFGERFTRAFSDAVHDGLIATNGRKIERDKVKYEVYFYVPNKRNELRLGIVDDRK